jgi:hypothetical protein
VGANSETGLDILRRFLLFNPALILIKKYGGIDLGSFIWSLVSEF